MPADAIHSAIRRLAFGGSLSAQEATDAFGQIMAGEASPAHMAGLLMGLRVKGETPDEVAGAARAAAGSHGPIEADSSADLVDTCGTGGGAVTTFNISTAAALCSPRGPGCASPVTATAPLRRNAAARGCARRRWACRWTRRRKRWGRCCGSPGRCSCSRRRCTGHAPRTGPVRRELGVPTVMNIVGPLANPAGAGRQVVGVADRQRLPLLAGALAALGPPTPWWSTASRGWTRFRPSAPRICIGSPRRPGDRMGDRPRAPGLWELSGRGPGGGSLADNARIVTEVLGGGGPPGAQAAVILNAAAAIHVSGNRRFHGERRDDGPRGAGGGRRTTGVESPQGRLLSYYLILWAAARRSNGFAAFSAKGEHGKGGRGGKPHDNSMGGLRSGAPSVPSLLDPFFDLFFQTSRIVSYRPCS